MQRASAIVQRFITDYAVSGHGLFRLEGRFDGESVAQNDKIVVERTAMMARCYEEAKDLLRKQWTFVDKLAEELVRRDTLVYEDILLLRGETEKTA